MARQQSHFSFVLLISGHRAFLYASEYRWSPRKNIEPVYLLIKFLIFYSINDLRTFLNCHLMKLTERKGEHDKFTTENRITLITSPDKPDRQQPYWQKKKTVWGKIDNIQCCCDRKNGFQLKHKCRQSNQVSSNMRAWSKGSVKKHAKKWSKVTLKRMIWKFC